MCPIQEGINFIRRGAIPDAGKVLVRQRRVDEWVLPGVVPRNPIADHGCELPDLEVDALRWAVAEKIFIQPHLGTFITWIESAVHARLRKDINLRSNLSIEKQS